MSTDFIPFSERYRAIRNHQSEKSAQGAGSILSGDDWKISEQGRKAFDQMSNLREAVGEKYADCNFDNFEVFDERYAEVVAKLRGYAGQLANITQGKNVILHGPMGTGKEHLLMSLACAVLHNFGYCPSWENGPAFFDRQWKLAYGKKDRQWTDCDEINAPIFWISDPAPSGNQLAFQQSKLFETVDHRYRKQMPTWITTNVNLDDPSEVDSFWTAPTTDRLLENALVIKCNWPSYRTQRHLE